MALIVPEESQRPYRFGMTLVCIGALFNWLGLADHHTKPVPAVRYIGVGLVASGAVLICMAMCFWMNSVRDDEDDVSVMLSLLVVVEKIAAIFIGIKLLGNDLREPLL